MTFLTDVINSAKSFIWGILLQFHATPKTPADVFKENLSTFAAMVHQSG